MRIAVVVSTAGPYWQARGRALAAHPEVEARLIAITGRERTYQWETKGSGAAWHVLAQGLYEDLDLRRTTKVLRAELERSAPDAILTLGYSDALMRDAARWAKSRDVVSTTAFAGTEVDRPRRWWREAYKRRLVRRLFDGAFATGERGRQYAVQLGFVPEHVVTGYNVVDNAAFWRGAAEVRRRAEDERNERGLGAELFLYVGRFAPEKNLRRLLEAYAKYRKQGGAWSLVLVGDGVERASLVRRIREGRIDAVHLHPWAQAHEVAMWYGLASCFVLASVSEPGALVVNEAMAAGLPMLVSDRCGSAPELVQGGQNGFTFDPEDIDGLAGLMARISELAPEERQAMGRRSQEIISHYTPESWAANLVELVRRISAAKAQNRRR